MKINITNHPKRNNGYINVCPFVGHNLGNFDNLCADNECTEIVADNILQFIPHHEVIELLKYWRKKLRVDGVVKIGGIEARLVNFAFLNGELSLEKFNLLTFGQHNSSWDFHNGLYTIDSITNILRQLGLKIVTKQIIGYNFVITARRENGN
jgi:hypothetical protein